MRRVFLALVLLVAPSQVWAAAETLYVRPSAACANNGDGTAYGCAASPGAAGAYRTFANVLTNASDETAGSVDPGDTLYICGAHTDQFTYGATGASTVGSGTAANRITISWDCPSDAGSIVGTGNNYGFYSEQDYLTLTNPMVSGGTLGSLVLYDNGGVETAQRWITVSGGTIGPNPNVGRMCLEARGQYITIIGVTVQDCATDGIWMKGKYNLVTGNTIRRVSTGDTNGDCIQFSGEVDGVIIRSNSCDHSNVDSKYCIISSGDTDAGHILIELNTCVRSITDTVGSGIYVEHPATVRSNIITGGQYGIQCIAAAAERCDVIGNLIQSANVYGVVLGSTSNIARVLNNTIVGATTTEGIHTDTTASTVVLSNNIITDAPIGINKAHANNVDRNNLFYSVAEPVAVASVHATPGTGSVTSDPLFVGSTNYRLRGTSPARRAGFQEGGCRDVRGRPCWLPPDIGAYQSTSGDPAATRAVRN